MNNDLISRSALIAEFERIYEAHYKCTVYQFIHDIFKAMFRRLKNAPTVDAVEVVRCKDCVYFLSEKLLCVHEGNMVFNTGKTTYPNCFCSYGERRTDG